MEQTKDLIATFETLEQLENEVNIKDKVVFS